MNLEKNRKINYELKKIEDNHPKLDYYELTFEAVDSSKIFVEVMIPKDEVDGLFVEIPDYKNFPKDYLNLGRYAIINYAVASLHIRAQAGRSENRLPGSMYFPFLTNQNDELYYKLVYQDAIDLVGILKKEFTKLPIDILGIGQGASIALVAAAVTKEVNRLFISNAMNVDFEKIFVTNADVGIYEPIRDYNRNFPEREEEMLRRLAEIDVLNYAQEVEAKVYYGLSHIKSRTPLVCQEKLLEKLPNKEVLHYRKFEHEVLQEHFFDTFVLKKLGER